MATRALGEWRAEVVWRVTVTPPGGGSKQAARKNFERAFELIAAWAEPKERMSVVGRFDRFVEIDVQAAHPLDAQEMFAVHDMVASAVAGMGIVGETDVTRVRVILPPDEDQQFRAESRARSVEVIGRQLKEDSGDWQRLEPGGYCKKCDRKTSQHLRLDDLPVCPEQARAMMRFAIGHGFSRIGDGTVRDAADQDELRDSLRSVLNSASAENASSTPDYVLAHFLTECLAAFNTATNERSRWHHDRLGG